jgi:PAS domain S-box-containing protein
MKTVMVANIVINVVCLIVLLQLWRQNHNKYAGLNYWVADWGLQVSGTLLIALRGTIPNWASMVLSNSMIVGGTLILYFGLCRFAGKKSSRLLNYTLLLYMAIFVFIHFYFTYIDNELFVRSLNSSIGLSLVCFLGMWLMFRGVDPEIRSVSRGAGFAFAAILLISLIRIMGFSVLPHTNNDYFQSGLFDTLLVLLLVGSIVFLTFNLVLMVNRRLYMETKQMEQTISKSQRELQATFNATSVGFAVLVNRVIKEVNEAGCTMLGYSRQEIIGRDTRLFYAAEQEYQNSAKLYPQIEKIGTVTTEIRLLRKDGEIVNAIMNVSAFDKKDLSLGVVLSLIDITERKKAEEKLRETRDYLNNLLDYANAPIIVWDTQLRITRFNHAFESLTGRKDQEVIGKSIEILFPPSTVADSMRLIRNTSGGERWETVEIDILNRDGSIRTVLWNSATILAPDGRTPVATIAQGQDITERKSTEAVLAEKSEALARSNTDLSQFAYFASHDLQEPLRMVSSYLQLIEQRYKDKLDAAGIEFISFAVDGANRMQNMINDLLAFSRVGTRGKLFEPTDCEVVLNQALSNLQIAIAESQAVITHDSLPIVTADNSQLIQLFQNLIANALKFHAQAVPLIHISAQTKGSEWLFSVRDNGIGIDPQYFGRLFIIFQRLHSKSEYPGTGIGLALCKRVVERHGGKIWVESMPGQGSIFYFTIPLKGGN